MRLIDEDKIGLTDFEIVMCNGDYKKALTMLLDKISNQPTAYDIDKQDGTSDDVCEWKNQGLYGYYTGCTEFRSKVAYKDVYWKYCPYCSKKIKVVE